MTTEENDDFFKTNNVSTQYGILAGILMSALLLIFQLSGSDHAPWLKLSKYILLAVSIVLALNSYRSKVSDKIFIKGAGLGFKLSLIAALILAIFNVALFFVAPEYTFSKYGVEPSEAGQAVLISAMLFFETLVFGGILTFIVLQFMKNRVRL